MSGLSSTLEPIYKPSSGCGKRSMGCDFVTEAFRFLVSLPNRFVGRLLAFFAFFTSAAIANAASPAIPAPPPYYVLDEPHLLSERALSAIQTLLVEQDRATGQQILVAIFKSLQGEDLNDRTNEIFKKWGIGARGKDNGALLAVFWEEHKARIEVGYGLEGQLTDARSKQILTNQLIPELREHDPDRAISLSVYQILSSLESPLIANGLADRILRSKAGFRGDWSATPALHSAQLHAFKNGWIVWLILGVILLTIVGNLLTSAEAHFTRDGWFRPKPWQRGRWGSPGLGGSQTPGGSWRPNRPVGGGGFPSGGSGDGGGFLGGGGTSGGGGASGDW